MMRRANDVGGTMRKFVAGVFLSVALSVGAVTAGALGTSALNSGTRGVVLFVGDSNITMGAQNIDWVLTWNTHNDNGYVPVLASRVGAAIRTPDCLDPVGCTTTDYWAGKLGSLEGKVTPDAIVVNLGVNDTASEGTPTTAGYSSYSKKIDYVMALTHGRPVMWTNLPCSLLPPARLTGCQTVNNALSLATKRWPNLKVLNWNLRAYGHPEYIVAGDIHLTSAGQAAWANFIVQKLDERFPAL